MAKIIEMIFGKNKNSKNDEQCKVLTEEKALETFLEAVALDSHLAKEQFGLDLITNNLNRYIIICGKRSESSYQVSKFLDRCYSN